MKPELSALSLGWGIQSWTLAAMSALGELPKVDFAIHSDTTWEHGYTYEFAAKWGPWLEDHGINYVCVTDQPQAAKVDTGETDAPFFTKGAATQALTANVDEDAECDSGYCFL